ncbi:Lrp/AsnC family transcriptional regulator [Actinocorallia longicatena]|uniref:Lrp/AsnC family transcriptional regulator n=1 Tax=Actinocorallia longicatena TaxID=111803 RepID=A0ABP6QM36_9ACTN
METVIIDALDRQIMHGLGLDGRVSFARLAEVIGVSDQTVARRYRRLRGQRLIRVVGLCDHRRTGGSSWWVRLQCAPGSAPEIGRALARRPDTVWVQLMSGGAEILCGVRTAVPDPRSSLLLDKLPRSSRITAVSAHSMLHLFAGGSLGDGAALIEGLDEHRVKELRRPPAPPVAEEPFELAEPDLALLALLGRDARIPNAELAADVGWSESALRRRMDHLRAAGVLYFDLEVDVNLLGLRSQAWLWLKVHPADLDAVGTELARHQEVPFAAATTGSSNLTAIVCCRSPEALYTYLTTRIGSLSGVQSIESAPVTITLKQGGAVMPAARFEAPRPH